MKLNSLTQAFRLIRFLRIVVETYKEVRNKNKCYLLLLDINMPKMNGVEVLIRIKSDNELKDIPVIMLTTTDNPREIETCYTLGCNMYITKPVQFDKFAETLNRMGLFLQIVKILN